MGFDRGGRNFRGGNRGNRGGRGGGRQFDAGPPDYVVEVGHFMHECENLLVCEVTCGKVPFFNTFVYFENKEQIGKIDEILGSPQETYFSVKLTEGIKASSFKEKQKLFIDPAKLLPMERFMAGTKPSGPGFRGGRGGNQRGRGFGDRNRAFGDRGGFQNRGGRGTFDNRGRFQNRGGRGTFDNRGRFQNRGGRGTFDNRGTKRISEGFGGSDSQNKKIKFDE